jgi:RNA polymerase sigma factor (sigma-70 family)
MLASQNDTIQLVKSAQAGDVEAFAILVQNYEREIYGYLTGLLGDREDAYDFAQQVFIKAWLNLGNLKSASCFKVWLYTIARNLTYDYWRGRKILYQSWENLEVNNVVEDASGPEDRIAEAELVHLALAELPPKLRQCLLLGVVGGFSRREIAEIVGIGETSVSTYISSARRQFRAIYQRLQNEQEIGDQANEGLKVYTLQHVGGETCHSMSR